jgi:hypothetical protein
MTDGRLEGQIEFLRSCGAAETSHSLSCLLEHLRNTREILASWGACRSLCDAGLFHSVYGTESFQVVSVDFTERESVREVIGAEAEEIAYLFSMMTRESFEANLTLEGRYRIRERVTGNWVEISPRTLRHLCNLSAANWLEQRPRLPVELRDYGRERYRLMLGFLLPAAALALSEAYNFRYCSS